MEGSAGDEANDARTRWLDTTKILELAAHDLNNLAHAALSYMDLAADPQMDSVARARFLDQARGIVRRASLFAPNLLVMMEARDSKHALEASGPLSAELDGALAMLRERFPSSSLKVARSGDAWGERAVGGKFVAIALYHLVDNAERFHRPGGPVNVTVDATREGDVLKLTVQDEGRGFSPGQDGYAAARFSEPGRVTGAGLGLATVRLVAERTGGSLQLLNSDAPRGARVVLRLRGAP